MPARVHFLRDAALAFVRAHDSGLHAHRALQLTLALEAPFRVQASDGTWQECEFAAFATAVQIQSNPKQRPKQRPNHQPSNPCSNTSIGSAPPLAQVAVSRIESEALRTVPLPLRISAWTVAMPPATPVRFHSVFAL